MKRLFSIKNNLTILTVVPSYKPAFFYGGPIRSISGLCESFVSSGHKVDVFTTNANGKNELEVEAGKQYDVDGVRVFYYNRWTRDHSNFSPGLLKNVFQKCDQYDVVHIHSWWNSVAVLSALICLWKGITPIISPRGSLTNFTFTYRRQFAKRFIHLFFGKPILKRSIVHVTSLQEKNETEQWIAPKKIFVINNVLNFPAIQSKPSSDRDYLKIIFVGRIDPAKNLEMLFDVLTHKVSIPYQLNILGGGDRRYVNELKAKTNGHPEINWMGNIDGNEKFRLMSESDILVLPSLTENFGNVVFEALSQGTPVLISKNVGAKDIIQGNAFGWVISFDEESWAQKINDAWKFPEYLNEIRRKAPEMIRNQFNTENLVKNYVDMYQETINQKVE